MKHVMKHNLDMALARRAADKACEAYSARFAEYNPTTDWETEQRANVSFTVKGVKLRGWLELVPGAVEMELQVPFIFRPFRKKALGIVEEEVRNWFAKAEAGELD